jgi:hypothetical protein
LLCLQNETKAIAEEIEWGYGKDINELWGENCNLGAVKKRENKISCDDLWVVWDIDMWKETSRHFCR